MAGFHAIALEIQACLIFSHLIQSANWNARLRTRFLKLSDLLKIKYGGTGL